MSSLHECAIVKSHCSPSALKQISLTESCVSASRVRMPGIFSHAENIKAGQETRLGWRRGSEFHPRCYQRGLYLLFAERVCLSRPLAIHVDGRALPPGRPAHGESVARLEPLLIQRVRT